LPIANLSDGLRRQNNRQSAIGNETGGLILETKRQYEVVFIVDPTADDEVSKLTESFTQIVTDQGGVVTKAETMGKRQLAYEILHHNNGTFVLLEIEGSGREIAELERRMRVNDRVLRYITVRVDEDRRRADKLKDRRARKAAKRPPAHGGQGRRGGAMEFADTSGDRS
jgi:small subunit ribosomal protein S6